MILFFFFNDTATTEIYTLSLHDALPILVAGDGARADVGIGSNVGVADIAEMIDLDARLQGGRLGLDRKSTRLNSSHSQISYAVFCLKKKNGASSAASDRGRWA